MLERCPRVHGRAFSYSVKMLEVGANSFHLLRKAVRRAARKSLTEGGKRKLKK